MKPIHYLALVTLLLTPWSLPAAAAPVATKPVQQSSQPALILPVEHFTLPNGLQVYLSPNHQSPRFYAQITVNTGSKEDPADATGIAHYLEHMLFKGTQKLGTANFAKEKPLLDEINRLYDVRFNEKDEKKRAELAKQISKLTAEASQFAIPNEFDSLYARMGAEGTNAYTSDEVTAYLTDLPANRFEQWAMVESERFANPVFRLFQSELETVYEEKNISMDNKEELLMEAVNAKLYKKHPYGTQTTLGTIEHLKNPSLNKMYAFYQNHYVPNNMAITIAGNIQLPEAKRVISHYFSKWQPKTRPTFVPPQESPLQQVERVQVQYQGEEKVLLAFPTAAYKSPDRLALMMIDMLLDGGEVGLIKNTLVNPQLVMNAGSYPSINKDYGAQYLYAIPREGQTLAEVESLLLAQIEKIKTGQFDEKLMQGIALDFEITQKRNMESNEGRVNLLSNVFLQGETLAHTLALPAKMRQLTKAEVIKVANRYFGKAYVAGYRLNKDQTVPKIPKPELEKMQLNPNQRSPFAQSVDAVAPKPIAPRWVDYTKDFQARSFAPGVVLYHAHNPLNDIFNLVVSYDFGDKHFPHLCDVMGELNFAGTGGLSAEQIKNQFYQMGVHASYNCSDYRFSMHLTGLDRVFPQALQQAEKLLWSATLDEKQFQNKIANRLKERQDEKTDLKQLRGALNSYIVLGDKSPFLDRSSIQELKSLSTFGYSTMTHQLKKQNFKIYYTGQLPVTTVEQLMHTHHQPQTINVPLLTPRQRPTLQYVHRHDKPLKIYFLDFKGVQSHINLMLPESPVNPNESIMARLYNEYFDGNMGAILFQEVRESRALAYSTWARYFEGSRLGDQDQMRGYIGTQADKTLEALKLFIELLRKTPASEGHFDRAKKAIENSYRTGYVNFQEVLGTIEGWAELGYDRDPRPENFARLSGVQLQTLLDYIKHKVSNQNLTFTIVGDKTRIDMQELAKLGEVEEVPLKVLFKD